MMNKPKSETSGISSSLISLIKADGLGQIAKGSSELGADYLDSMVNELFQDKVLGEVPALKTIIAGVKVWNGISTYMFVKKLITFLFEIRSISTEERELFLARLDGNKRQEIIDQLAIVLDKHDHLMKSEIQGRLFTGMIKGYLNQNDYLSLTHSVDQIDVTLLETLKMFYISDSHHVLSAGDIYSLASLRLVGIDNSEIGLVGGGGPIYRRNRLGIMLVAIGLRTKIPFDYTESVIGSIESEKLYAELGYQHS